MPGPQRGRDTLSLPPHRYHRYPPEFGARRACALAMVVGWVLGLILPVASKFSPRPMSSSLRFYRNGFSFVGQVNVNLVLPIFPQPEAESFGIFAPPLISSLTQSQPIPANLKKLWSSSNATLTHSSSPLRQTFGNRSETQQQPTM